MNSGKQVQAEIKKWENKIKASKKSLNPFNKMFSLNKKERILTEIATINETIIK